MDVDEKLASLDWVEDHMRQILDWTENGGNLDQSAFSNFYFNVSKYCAAREPVQRMGGRRVPHAMMSMTSLKPQHGTKIYERFFTVVEGYIKAIRQGMEGMEGYEYMEAYRKAWTKLSRAMGIINNCLRFMNEQWGAEKQKRGVKAHTALLVSVKIWQEEILDQHCQLTPFVIEFVGRDRNDEAVDVTLLKSVIDSVGVVASVDEKHYESLKNELVSSTEMFYTKEAAEFLAQNSFSDYLKKVEDRILQEISRVEQYLGEKCRPRLLKTVDHVLVVKHLDLYLENFPVFLEEKRMEDLRRLYFLISRAESTRDQPIIPLINEQFEHFIVETGTKSLAGKRERFVDAILEVDQFFKTMLEQCFQNDHVFTQSYDLACRKFINKFEGGVAPKLLASFADRMLKKTEKMPDDDRDQSLDSIILVMRHLDEKDKFMTYFGNCLSKRLINNLCAGDGRCFEKKMIERMKMISGRDHVAGLNQMMNDMETSEELMNEFTSQRKARSTSSSPFPLSFSALFLTSGIWAKVKEEPQSVTLPAKMLECKEVIEKMYKSKFSARSLKWAHQLSTGVIRLTFTKGKDGREKDYDINCSGYMMVILDLFNRKTIRDLKSITELTNIPSQELKAIIVALTSSKVKLLNMRPAKEEISDKTEFCLNPKFFREGREITIMIKDQQQEQRDDSRVRHEIEEARNHEIQACIVRIMKAKKTMEHRLLVPEVMSHLQDRFKAEVPKIKRCIDILIEKDYLERSDEKGSLYRYIS